MAKLYSVLKEKLNKIEVNGKTLYVAEGDTLLDDEQLKIYADVREKENEAREAAKKADAQGFGTARLEVSHGLVAMTRNGKVVRWSPGIVLSYRVVRASFPGQQQYQLVVDNLKLATEEWERTCGVNFEHRAQLDGAAGNGPNGCLFVVYAFDAGGSVIASSFFPAYRASFPSSFSCAASSSGVSFLAGGAACAVLVVAARGDVFGDSCAG